MRIYKIKEFDSKTEAEVYITRLHEDRMLASSNISLSYSDATGYLIGYWQEYDD